MVRCKALAAAVCGMALLASQPLSAAPAPSAKLDAPTRALVTEILTWPEIDGSRDPGGNLPLLENLAQRSEANGRVPPLHRATLMSELARAHFYLRQYARAVEYHEKAAHLLEEGKADPAELAALLNNQATVLSSLARFEESEARHLRALAIRKSIEGERGPAVASSLFNLGYVYYRQGRLEEAVTTIRAGVEQQVAFKGEDDPLSVMRLTSLASILGRTGREDEALAAARRAEAAGRRALGEAHPTYAIVLNNLGTALIENGLYEESLPVLRETLRVRRATIGERASGTAVSLRNLSTALKKTGHRAEAEEVLQAAVDILIESRETDTPNALSYMTQDLADFAAARGDWADYDRLSARARADADAKLGEANSDRAHIHLYHAASLMQRDRSAEALAIAERWVPVMQAALIAGHKDRIWAELLLARLRQAAGNSDWLLADAAIGALTVRLSSLSATDRQLVREADTNRESALLYLDTALAAGDNARAFAALQLANISELAMGQQFAIASAGGGTALTADRQGLLELGRKVEEARARHSRSVELRQGEVTDRLAAALDQARTALAAAETSFARAYPGFIERYRPSPLSLADLQARLQPRDLLLAPVEAQGRVTVLRITRRALDWNRPDAGAVKQAITAIRASVESGGEDPFPETQALALYRALLPRGLGSKQRVLLHGGGALASLPLGLLQTAPHRGDLARAPWLVRKAAVQVLGNLANLGADDARPASAAEPLFAGIGGPDLPSEARSTMLATLFRNGRPAMRSIAELPPLPSARAELEAIGAALSGARRMMLIGPDASEERFKAADLSRVTVLAFATHGLVAGEMRGLWEPALLLGKGDADSAEDGLLGASEIARLRLGAEWVILSACNTAAGDGATGAVYSGLATAFAQAGAQALLLSHWRVRDDAAARLSVATVRGAASGMGKAQALRRAQLALIGDRTVAGSAHPAIWAPFVIVAN